MCHCLGAECEFDAGYDEDEIGSEDGDGWEDDMEDSAEGAGCGDLNGRLANRRRGKGTGNPGKPGKKLRLADLQSQFGVGLKVWICLWATQLVCVGLSKACARSSPYLCAVCCVKAV